MKDYIKERVKKVAKFIVENDTTIRETAAHFKYARDTVRLDMVERLPQIDEKLANEVRAILDRHFEDRGIRGSKAWNRKFEDKRCV